MNINFFKFVFALSIVLSAQDIYGLKTTPIGVVQGEAKGKDAHLHESPIKGKSITIQGVIHQVVSWKDRNGNPVYGCFLQNLPNESDKNPKTSDGIFIFLGKYKNLYDGKNQIKATLGLHIAVSGTVGEYYNSTQISRPRVQKVFGTRQNWNKELKTTLINPPNHQDEVAEYWEALESMRCGIKRGAIVSGPSKTVGGDEESYVWIIPGDHKITNRKNPLFRRVFRDAHPLDDIPDQRFDNGNGFRILLSSLKLRSNGQLIKPTRSGSVLNKNIFGAVHYSYSNYKISINDQPNWTLPTPSQRVSEKLPSAPGTWSVMTYNVENLYDHRNDLSDPCDAVGDKGKGSVRPPFNYLPSSQKEYLERIALLGEQFVSNFHQPDILLIQEIEDQDINKDGAPDVLQDLSEYIKKKTKTNYLSFAHRNGADDRGINCAFMIRKDKWSIHNSFKTEKSLNKLQQKLNSLTRTKPTIIKDASGLLTINGSYRDDSGNLQTTFSRPLQVLSVRPINYPNAPKEVFLLNNHFSSIPNQRVSRRTAQAHLVAATARSLSALFPDAGIIIGGDLNVFPQPDDGTPEKPSYQLKSIYDLGWHSADAYLNKNAPETNYTYIYNGQSQTLDHLFFSPSLKKHFRTAAIPHLNADFPDHPSANRASDHEPVALIFNH